MTRISRVALLAGTLIGAACGGRTTTGAAGRDASPDTSNAGTSGAGGFAGGSGAGGAIATGATGGTAGSGGAGATGGSAEDGAGPGACAGVVCASPSSCIAGVCVCPGSRIYCDGACVDAQSDDANCGGCGIGCSPPLHCKAGTCVGDACDPAFCPTDGVNKPCCITPDGPCGMDFGFSCNWANDY